MIPQTEIKELIEGKKSKNQIVTCIVIAKAEIIPTVVLNVYLNLDMTFLTMNQVVSEKKSNLTLAANQTTQPQIMVHYYFSTKVCNFEKYFGPYKPGKILPFEMVGK